MKLQGWEQKLSDYLRMCHSGEISLTRYDCALFVATWVQIATGLRVNHSFLRPGINQQESLRMLLTKSAEACVSEVLPNIIPISQAMRGDIVLLRQSGLSALGICDGGNSHFLHETIGLRPVLTSQCDLAWSVE